MYLFAFFSIIITVAIFLPLYMCVRMVREGEENSIVTLGNTLTNDDFPLIRNIERI